jgi:hypothetical protein
VAKAKIELKEDQEYALKKISEPEPAEQAVRLKLKPETEQIIADLLMKQIDSAPTNKERQEFIEHEKYCRSRYLMEDLETDWPWEGASKRRTGDTTIAVDRLKPRLHKSFFYTGRIWDVSPEGNSTIEIAEKQEKWLDSIARNEMKLEEISRNLEYDAIMLNFGVLKCAWDADPGEVREEIICYETPQELLRNYPNVLEKYPQYIFKLSGIKSVEALIKNFYDKTTNKWNIEAIPSSGEKIWLMEQYRDEFNGTKGTWIDPKNMYYPEGTTDENKAWYNIERQEWTRDELEEAKKSGFFNNVDDLLKVNEKEPGKKFEVFEGIVRYDYNSDGRDEKSVFWFAKGAAGKNLYLRGIKFPYTHNRTYFIIFRTTEHRYGFYMGGLGRKLKSINCAQDKTVNQVSNAWDQAIVRAWLQKVVPGSPYDPKKHKFFPGANIPTKVDGEITELKTSDIPSSSMTMQSHNSREVELLSGIPQYAMSGQVNQQDPTGPARKEELLLAESNVNIGDYVKEYSFGMKELAYQIQSDHYQFTNTKEADYRADMGFESISKREMRAKAKFDNKTAVESVATFEKSKNSYTLFKMIGQHPLIAGDIDIQWAFLKNIMSYWSEDWAKEADKLLSDNKKKEIQEKLRLAQEQAAAAANAGGGAGGGQPGGGQ